LLVQQLKTTTKIVWSYLKKSFSFIIAYKKGLIGLAITSLTLFVLFKPNISIKDDKTLNPLDPFQTTFTICNNSNFGIKDITYKFKADIELMNKIFIHNVKSFDNNKKDPYHQDKNNIDSIGSWECSTINPTGYSMPGIITATLKIDYLYSYFFLPFNNTETFKAKKDISGNYQWSKYIN